MSIDPQTTQNRSCSDQGVSRRHAIAVAGWSAPVIALATMTPAAAASTSQITAVNYTNFQAANFQGGQINVNRPLSFTLTGAPRAGDLIELTVAGSMTLTGGTIADAKSTPLRISSVNGPNFNVVSSAPGPGGAQTLTLVANRTLPAGSYSKTISWVPLEGATSESTQQAVLTWELGTYTAQIDITVAGIAGRTQAYTLNRFPDEGEED